MAIENFLTYIEEDNVNDRLQVAAAHIDHYCHRDEKTYVYKDFTLDHFGDFEHLVDGRLVSGVWLIYVWALANIVDDIYGIDVALGDSVAVHFYGGPNSIGLRESAGGVVYGDTSDFNFIDNVWYYFKIKKVGTTLTCKIYDASTRLVGDLLDTLTLILQGDYKFRYMFPTQSHTLGAHTDFAIGDIANLDLQEGWRDKINGITNLGKINGISVANIAKVNGIASS